MTFPCTSCGACCRKLFIIPKEIRDLYGIDIDKKGTCVNLKDNKCSIYDDRPDICRIDKMKPKSMSNKDYIAHTIQQCNNRINEEGLDKKYLIKT